MTDRVLQHRPIKRQRLIKKQKKKKQEKNSTPLKGHCKDAFFKSIEYSFGSHCFREEEVPEKEVMSASYMYGIVARKALLQ